MEMFSIIGTEKLAPANMEGRYEDLRSTSLEKIFIYIYCRPMNSYFQHIKRLHFC